MMTTRLSTAIIGLGLAFSASAVEPALKAIELPGKRVPLTIDGDFADWGKKVRWRTDFMNPGHAEVPEGKLKFALKRDWGNLFVAFRFDGAYRRSETHVRHDGAIWKENSVLELFFSRPDSAAGFTQFSLAANGDRQDGKDGDSYVTPDWEAVVKTDERGWQAEIRIPFKEIEVNAKNPEDFRMNLSMAFPRVKGDPLKTANWSLAGGTGFKYVADMGYVVPGSFQKGSLRAIAAFEKTYGEKPRTAEVAPGDERGYLAFLQAIAAERAAKDAERVRRLAERLAAETSLAPVLVQGWDPDRNLDETPAAQADVLEQALAADAKPLTLAFESAQNETTHRSFVLSAPRELSDVTFGLGDLTGAAGTLPAAQLRVARFAFLHTPDDMRSDGRAARLPYPEIVECVAGPQAFKAGESSLFRLYVDTRNVKPGAYAGEMTVGAAGRTVKRLPVTVNVCDLALPLPETHPFDVYLFTTIPWGGESAELWARFFRDHYMTDVSFEHPQLLLDGKPVDPKKDLKPSKYAKPPANKHEAGVRYVEEMLDPTYTEGLGVPSFDFTKYAMDERLRACAKYGLRPVMSNRNGFIPLAYFPKMMEGFAACGLKPNDVLYKLGDEDNSLVFLPVAKRLRETVPGLRTTMIPSGTSYWDLKPAAEGFTDFTFSAAAYRGGEEGYRDIAYLQSKGVKVSRYLNQASWAGRTLPIRARNEPWEALVVDGLDGYACWTAGIRPNSKYRTGYSGYNPKYVIPDLPPDRQIASFLVYIRRTGDVYRPVSCIRLENIRDGIIDAIYYKLAKERAEKSGDAAMRTVLRKIAARPKPTIAAYETARAELRAMLVK